MGVTYLIQPIAPIEANTVRVPAGAVTFGLEMRQLNPSIVRDFYDDRPDGAAVQELMEQNGELEDNGLSIHVFGSEDGLEYLRFDCFANGPHYHYIHPHEDRQVVNEIDPVAVGDPFEWAIARIGDRLAEMLSESGGTDIADRLEPTTTLLALERLVQLQATAVGRERHE